MQKIRMKSFRVTIILMLGIILGILTSSFYWNTKINKNSKLNIALLASASKEISPIDGKSTSFYMLSREALKKDDAIESSFWVISSKLRNRSSYDDSKNTLIIWKKLFDDTWHGGINP